MGDASVLGRRKPPPFFLFYVIFLPFLSVLHWYTHHTPHDRPPVLSLGRSAWVSPHSDVAPSESRETFDRAQALVEAMISAPFFLLFFKLALDSLYRSLHIFFF